MFVRLLTLPAQYAEQGLCNGRAYVRLSVCPSRRSTAAMAAVGGFAAERPCGQEILIDNCGRHAQAPVLSTDAGSVMLRADGGGWRES